jgi:predicted Zn-dependent peptidase
MKYILQFCLRRLFPAAAVIFSACSTTEKSESIGYKVPIEYYTLKNGLRVVLSVDKTAPSVIVSMYYNIGFRIEPKDRTGFAHLFEHMMFQGSENLGKNEFTHLVEENGGFDNGSTRFDFTNYFEVVPSHKLETMLWAEADRMKGLAVTQDNLTNQQGVVKNEVRVNVLNQPYGGFPWLDMPQVANENWFNAHNFYGDLEDLDAAKLEDVDLFFKTFYSPNNAVLAVVGDIDTEETKGWVEKYFSAIPAAQLPPPPDLSEPEQTKEKRVTQEDKLANKPAIAIAYKMPERRTPEYFAFGLIDQMLLQGQDSRLYESIVQDKGYTANVSGGINYLGNMFNYKGPMLWMFDLIYDPNVSADSIIAVSDATIGRLKNNVTQADIDLANVKMKSALYDNFGSLFSRADLLACFALFDNDPNLINSLEAEFAKVTPELVKATIDKYLVSTNRTILIREPSKQDAL